MRTQAPVLVVTLRRCADCVLRGFAERYGCSVLCATDPDRAFEEVLRIRPPVVLVQVHDLGPGTELIARLAACDPPIRVIAISSAHSEEIERTLRCAGAAFYAPSGHMAEMEAAFAQTLTTRSLPLTGGDSGPVTAADRGRPVDFESQRVGI